MVAVVPMRTLLVKTRRDRGQRRWRRWTGQMGRKQAAAYPCRLSACAIAGERRPWIESSGAPGCGAGGDVASSDHETLVAPGYRPAPETPLKQPNSRAHRHTRRASREQGRERRSSQRKRVSRARRAARARPRHDTAHTGRRSVSTEITLTYCPVCTLVFRAPSDSPTRRGS